VVSKHLPEVEKPVILLKRLLYMRKQPTLVLENTPGHLIGEYLKVYVAYFRDAKTRFLVANGGLATTLLTYFLEGGHVDAVMLPKSCFKGGLAYGV